jgi:deoxyribodipyrimidine photo-lyase
MTTLVWLRNDLRLEDNPALYRASEPGSGVVACYLLCAEFVERHTIAPVRLDFIRRHLQLLATQLQSLNIPLILEGADKAGDIPQVLLRIAQSNRCEQLYFNAEYPLDELERDRAVAALLRENNIAVKRFHDRVIVPPGMIRNGQGEPYKVFTAFKKRWLQTVMPVRLQPLPVPVIQPKHSAAYCTAASIDQLFSQFPLRDLSRLWPAGEDEARRRLQRFVKNDLHHYRRERDFPAHEGTSTLSPYLAVGSISPRQCLTAVLAANKGEWDTGSDGATCWIGEIIWREFYQHVVVDYPQVCKNKAMQAHTEAFPWNKDRHRFQQWCDGTTGIPIVDAAMLQLKATGWMHNRLRMVVAMFLTKNLQIDWRLGETYFMSQLIDGDFAANNGGWQWSASTGTDAAPYFRIFNPVSQSERFDPDGSFIRKYLPVISHLPNKQIHMPPVTKGYPLPIVDLASSRKSTIELFGKLGAA